MDFKQSIVLSTIVFTLSTHTHSFKQLQLEHAATIPKQTQLRLLHLIQRNGVTHSRLQQLINGIPIWGNHILKHQYPDQTRYTGTLFSHVHTGLNTQAALSGREAVKVLRNSIDKHHLEYQHYSPHHIRIEKVYFPYQQSLRLSYVVNYVIDTDYGRPMRPFGVIDATTGQLLKQWDGLEKASYAKGPGGNIKTGRYLFGNEFSELAITVQESESRCILENQYVSTKHYQGRTTNQPVYHFDCPVQNQDEINGAFSPLNDAHHAATLTAQMFDYRYHDPLTNHPIHLAVHYGQQYSGAFWDGDRIAVGDGDENHYPFATVDFIAHEMGHVFTEQHSELQPWGQSGAIAESFADLTAQAAQYYIRLHNSWHIGDDQRKSESAIRYMDSPEQDGISISHIRDYRDHYREPHRASGIFNRFFYLLSQHPGWHTQKVYDVVLDANRYYWEPMLTFEEAAQGIIRATLDQHHDPRAVVQSFKKIGISCEKSNHNDYNCQTQSISNRDYNS